MASDPRALPETAEALKALVFGFDDWPLEHFRGMSAEEIESHGGIGPKYRERIQAALARLAELEPGDAAPVVEPEAPAEVDSVAEEPAGEPAEEPAEEPAGEHGHADRHAEPPPLPEPTASGSLAIVVMVVLILAIIFAAIKMGSGGHDEEAQAQIQSLQVTVAAAHATLGGIASEVLSDAEQQAMRALRRTRDGNFGLAREMMDQVRASLRTLRQAEGEVPPAEEGRREAIAEAEQLADAAAAALRLETPQTQEAVETAVGELARALRALAGEVTEVPDGPAAEPAAPAAH